MNMFNSIFVAVATIWATATAASTPRLWRDGGRSNHRQQRGVVGKNKFSKKQNVVQQQCTLDQFVGDYKYVNCQGVESKVGIACDKDNGPNPCNYTEAPLNNDNDDGCVVQGFFDATHIMTDPARPGVCQLSFVPLEDSCKANALPSGFGMKAEVDMTAGHADTSSTLLLWFSTDGGVVYYNKDEPQKTAFLHHDFPTGRKLGGCPSVECDPEDPEVDCECNPMTKGSFFSKKCEENDCTSDVWNDGCAACRCFKKENASWCDGFWNKSYDKYFDDNKKNLWGDTNILNRKCHAKYCDPREKEFFKPNNSCKEDACAWGIADETWRDGCEACKCYNTGNESWCDGTKTNDYDKYFKDNGENPWGDSNRENRYCNTEFKKKDETCKWDWQCECTCWNQDQHKCVNNKSCGKN